MNSLQDFSSERESSVSRQAIATQDKLDIVRDCADLAGEFPANVTLRFIYWDHGGLMMGASMDEIRTYTEPLVEPIIGADVVAHEIAWITGIDDAFKKSFTRQFNVEYTTKNYVETILELTNRFIQCKSVSADDDLWLMEHFGSMINYGPFMLARQLLERGQPMPHFIGVDAYEVQSDDCATDEHPLIEAMIKGEQGDEAMFAASTIMIREREALVLRQLHRAAEALAQDGQQHIIAVIQGCEHTFTSIAAQKLGAPIERKFLDRPLVIPFHLLLRDLRMSGKDFDRTSEGMLSELDITMLKVHSFFIHQRRQVQQLLVPDQDVEVEETRASFQSESSVVIRLLQGKLTPDQEAIFMDFHDTVGRYWESVELGQAGDWEGLANALQRYLQMIEDANY